MIHLKERHKGWLLILPTLIIMAVFTVYPLAEGLRLAFTNMHLLRGTSNFVGLANFERLLSDEVF